MNTTVDEVDDEEKDEEKDGNRDSEEGAFTALCTMSNMFGLNEVSLINRNILETALYYWITILVVIF